MNHAEAIAQHPELAPWWEAAAEGRFVLPHCQGCDSFHWYPRILCPHCGSTDIAWRPSEGKGQIYSVVESRFFRPAVQVAYIELEEGPRLLANVESPEGQMAKIGDPVVMLPPQAGAVPKFRTL